MKYGLIAPLVLAACASSSQLVKSVPEPAGSNCASGGVAIEAGTDDNENGVLDDNEVDSVNYVCNGTAASQALVDVSAEPAGANCASGGYAVRTGTDTNGNGMLDADEVQHVAYVCNGSDGGTQLVTTQPEPAGQNCETGGIAILVGTDSNGDGMLSADEVTSTSYVCNGAFAGNTIAGNFRIDNTLDIALLTGIREISGYLSVAGNLPIDTIMLPDLERVGGLYASTAALQQLSLPALQTTGDVHLYLPSITTLSFPALTSTGELNISAEQLQSFSAPAMTTVAGPVYVYAPALPACQITDILDAIGYTGVRSIMAAPC